VRVLGIDVGLNGAIAVVEGDRLIEVHDMPTFTMERNGKNKRMVNAAELTRLIRQASTGSAYLERLSAMPGQGVTSMFSMGQSLGVVLGILAALDIPTTTIPPRTWQKALDVPQGKDGSRYRAAQLFPAHAAQFARVKDDGRSDAALIAAYGATVKKG
jgi:crossover junction endodeoxyribonuclease RuvC